MSIPILGAALKTAFAAFGKIGAGLQAALSVGTTATNYLGAKARADAQEAANQQANERARQYMIEDYDQMTRMSDQERAAAGQRLDENQRAAAKTAASAQVASSAGGVSGLSVDALLSDIYGQEASIRDSVNQNLEATGHQISMERKGVNRQYTTAINTRPQPNQPSLLGAALEGVTGVYGAYKDNLRIRAKLGNRKA